jgi:FAD/FMN-containing dehydrogenase
MLRLDRLLSLDREAGVLECEAGVSLGDVLEAIMPHGFFLPVVPGTRHVTIGGAIASDIHGKNHHRDGTFSNWVLDMKVLTPAGEIVVCSPHEYRDLFWATVGGMGLTGIILAARITLVPVRTRYMTVDYRRAQDLDALLSYFESDERHKYSVAWIDCLAKGGSLGRAVLMVGDHAIPERVDDDRLDGRMGRARLGVPFDAPGLLLSRPSILAFNELYYRVHRTRSDALVRVDKYFFPLDGVANWNRLYGRRGFVQYQAVVPAAGGEAAVQTLLEQLSRSGASSFLAVLKKMGAEGEGMLSFPFEGYTLALDIPRRRGLGKLLAQLDRTVLDVGGRIYLAKDASLTAGAFREMYPRLSRFRKIKEALDPAGLLSSSQARRLGIAPDPTEVGG